jgi:hypothetical protein
MDIPYRHPPAVQPKARKGKGNRPRKGKKYISGITTGDVASILEAKYHPMEIYFTLNQKTIVNDMGNSLKGSLERIMMGGPLPSNPFAGVTDKIETGFKRFLASGGMEKIGYPGVPTAAALKGVNHRLAHPYSRNNPRRSSFVDTGQYMGSFKAWMTP